MLKNLSAMRETGIRSSSWEDPLEKEMATHSSVLTWEIPWSEEPGSYSPRGRKGHNWATNTFTFIWEANWFCHKH